MISEDCLYQIFLHFEVEEIFQTINRVCKSWEDVTVSNHFLLEVYKINFEEKSTDIQTPLQTIKEKFTKIMSFETDLVGKKPKKNTNYEKFYKFIMESNLHKFLHNLLRQNNVKLLVKSIIPKNEDIVLFKTDLLNHKLLNKLHPMLLIYSSIIHDSFECLKVILDHFDGPLYHLNNPSYLFVNSYHERRAPIHTCAFYGKLKLIKFLQQKQANLKLTEVAYGQTILHIAVSRNFMELASWLLIKNIISPNAKDRDGWSPLDIAASKLNYPMVKLLKKYNALETEELDELSKTFLSTFSSKKSRIIRDIDSKKEVEYKWKRFELDDNEILKYKKGKIIGKGTFGKVYVCQKKQKEIVALKEIFCKDTDSMNSCYQECLTALKLDHPNILKYNHVFSINDEENGEGLFVFIESEFYPLGDLYSFIKNYPLDEDMIIQFSTQIISGINYLHSKRIVHRDLKPQNILVKLNDRKDDIILSIGDLGASKSFTSIKAGSIAGTEFYAAP